MDFVGATMRIKGNHHLHQLRLHMKWGVSRNYLQISHALTQIKVGFYRPYWKGYSPMGTFLLSVSFEAFCAVGKWWVSFSSYILSRMRGMHYSIEVSRRSGNQRHPLPL